jgi:hypothetical protein
MAVQKKENPASVQLMANSSTVADSVIFIDLLIISILEENALVEDLLSIPFERNRDRKLRVPTLVQTLISLQAERLRVFHSDNCKGIIANCVPTCQSNGSTVCCVNSFTKAMTELTEEELRYDNKDINFKLPKIITWGDCLIRAYKTIDKQPTSVTSIPLNSTTPTGEDIYLVSFGDNIKLVEIVYKNKTYEIKY